MAMAISAGAQAPVQAAACPTPASDLGTLTLTVNIPATTTYTIWSRMMIPDSANNSVNLQVDTTDCYSVGGGSIAANSWTWVNYASGSTSTLVRQSLSAGSHTLKYIGTKAGVSLDRIIITSDASCTPTGVGDNCQTGDSTPPTVSIVSPSNNQTVSGPVTISASANDSSGIKDVKFLIDGQVVSTVTASPYNYAWNSSSATNGNHTLTAQATDNANNTATSSPVVVTVTGGSNTKKGDLNGDGKVNITDLSILLTNWGKPNPTPAQGDLNGDGKINISDLSILLSNWG